MTTRKCALQIVRHDKRLFIESQIVNSGHVQPGSLAIYVDKSIKCEQVYEELEKIKATRGLPQRIKVDNGSEFISRALDA